MAAEHVAEGETGVADDEASQRANLDVDSFVASLHRLDKTVAERNMPLLSEQLQNMNPAATDRDINQANEAVAPFRLPAWLEALYRWHNGSGYRGLNLDESGLRFMPLKEAVDQYGHLCASWNGFGWYRRWSWPLLMADSDLLIATLDYAHNPTEPILCGFHMEDRPYARWESPQIWINEITQMYELLEEQFVHETSIDWFRQLAAVKKDFAPSRAISEFEFGVSTLRWPESLLHRAGIAELTVNESELPPMNERRLRRDQGIPHPGPWDFYFGDLLSGWYQSPPIELPAQARLWSEWKGNFQLPLAEAGVTAVLPAGVLPDHAVVNGLDVDVVVWFDPETLEDETPNIQRIAYPR